MAMAISINTAQINQADRSACRGGDVSPLLPSGDDWPDDMLPPGKSLTCGSGDDVDMRPHSFMTNSRPDCEPT